jgi:hypothetical protein
MKGSKALVVQHDMEDMFIGEDRTKYVGIDPNAMLVAHLEDGRLKAEILMHRIWRNLEDRSCRLLKD